jgi:chlorobactene glucosyltransferase
MTQLVWVAPWALLVLALPLLLRRRPRLVAYPPPREGDAPRVSVIIPARNEANTIGICVASVLGTSYPSIEVIVVDDGSEDGTEEVAVALAERSDGWVRMIRGEPPPAGWLGKSWACWQGYREANGELLLFADADTRHDPELLGHAVGALLQERAAAVSVLPRQILKGFWERVVMPQILWALHMRYRDLRRVNRATNPRDVLSNGQFILVRREAYDAVGGHRGVRGEVVEDLRLAQRLTAAGHRVFLAHAEELMEVRMYRSLGGIIEGWSKNLAIGSRQTVDPWLRPAVPWLIAAFIVAAWVLPPAVLLLPLLGGPGAELRGWAAATTAISLLHWLVVLARFRVRPSYAVLYPVGAVVAAGIVVRSAVRGRRVRWKGRDYVYR